jgi:predicted Zn-dependent protease with MMP-like domain
VIEVTDEQFERLIAESMDELPAEHMRAVQNVAITYADEPTEDQRVQLELRNDQSLFGLYEGIPLARRQGLTSYPPDRITIFKLPIAAAVSDEKELKAQIKHTLWHEVAHYFGLDHPAIHTIERNWK